MEVYFVFECSHWIIRFRCLYVLMLKMLKNHQGHQKHKPIYAHVFSSVTQPLLAAVDRVELVAKTQPEGGLIIKCPCLWIWRFHQLS